MNRTGPIGPAPSLEESINQFLGSRPHGWCSRNKADLICSLVERYRPKLAIEVGVFGGASLVVIGLAMREFTGGFLIGVDPWQKEPCLEGMLENENRQWWSSINYGEIELHCRKHLQDYGLSPLVQLIKGKIEDQTFPAASVDLAHFDGNHSEASSVALVEQFWQYLHPGSVVLFDDVNWMEGGRRTQERALRLLLERGKQIAHADNGNCVAVEIAEV